MAAKNLNFFLFRSAIAAAVAAVLWLLLAWLLFNDTIVYSMNVNACKQINKNTNNKVAYALKRILRTLQLTQKLFFLPKSKVFYITCLCKNL